MPNPAKPLNVDLAELANALEDHSGLAWYFDTQSGDVVPVPDDADDEYLPAPRDELEESTRFLFIEPIASSEGWNDMSDFAETVTDRRLRELLDVALAGKGAFRRFRDVLAGYPAERARWFEVHDRRIQDRAREWLDSHEIAWTARRVGAPAALEASEPGSGKADRDPPPGPATAAGARCDVCTRTDLDARWVEVEPEGKLSRVTVDVTIRLCPDHRRRLLEAVGLEDAEELEPSVRWPEHPSPPSPRRRTRR